MRKKKKAADDLIDQLPCIQQIKCHFITYPCDNGEEIPLPSTLNESDFDDLYTPYSPGSTAAELLNDLLSQCPTEVDGAFEGGENTLDAITCSAIRELRNCTYQWSAELFQPENAHNILALLNTSDCDETSPNDDPGMVSEIAEHVCENIETSSGPERDELIDLVISYATYVGLNQTSDVVCFDEFVVISEFIAEEEIEITVGEFLESFDVEDCIESTLGCRSIECEGSFRDCVSTKVCEAIEEVLGADLTAKEKLLATSHLPCAIRIRENMRIAFEKERELFGGVSRNTCGDAFRHAFFNALNAQDCGFEIGIAFGFAHECDVPEHLTLEKSMDLANNNVGANIGGDNRDLSSDEIADLILEEMRSDKLFILHPINFDDPNFQETGGIFDATLIEPLNLQNHCN